MGFFGDVKDAKFWRQIATRRDAIIRLNDSQAMEDAMKAGKGLNTEDYTVKSIKRYRHQEANAEWIFFLLSGKQELFLMVRVVDDDADAYVMFCEDLDGTPIIAPDNRKGLLDDGNHFLFQPPEDENCFVPSDLDWTREFVQEMPDRMGKMVEAQFRQEDMGTQYTEVSENPCQPILEGALCGITEFFTQADVDNPQFVVVEEGIDWNPEEGTGKPEGGYCTFYVGCHVDDGDVEVSLS